VWERVMCVCVCDVGTHRVSQSTGWRNYRQRTESHTCLPTQPPTKITSKARTRINICICVCRSALTALPKIAGRNYRQRTEPQTCSFKKLTIIIHMPIISKVFLWHTYTYWLYYVTYIHILIILWIYTCQSCCYLFRQWTRYNHYIHDYKSTHIDYTNQSHPTVQSYIHDYKSTHIDYTNQSHPTGQSFHTWLQIHTYWLY